jgi:hypothetical protein
LNPYTHLWLVRINFIVGGSPCKNGHVNLSLFLRTTTHPIGGRVVVVGLIEFLDLLLRDPSHRLTTPPTNDLPTNHRRQATTPEGDGGKCLRPAGASFQLVRCTLPYNLIRARPTPRAKPPRCSHEASLLNPLPARRPPSRPRPTLWPRCFLIVLRLLFCLESDTYVC